MASVWMHRAGEKKPFKVIGGLSDLQAIATVVEMGTKAEDEGLRVCGYKEAEIFFHKKGVEAPVSCVFIERLSPPSRPERPCDAWDYRKSFKDGESV